MIKRNTVICADCLPTMQSFEDNEIDAIVTDPPYGLSFMAKEWDHGIPGIPFWQEALRVCKPGAHMLAFGGTRTHHRLMVAIEDAGWEIRDCLMWVYGCLSEDTEILTINGWEHYHKSTTFISDKIPILVYDVQKGIFKWEVPERWSEYSIQQDTCYRIQSDNTDQLVSRNHRCLVEREGKLTFVPAEELYGVEDMPTLPDNFFELYKGQPTVLLSSMQRILSWAGLENIRASWTKWVDTKIKRKFPRENVGCEQPGMERGCNILQDAWELRWGEICSLPSRILVNGTERRVCDGTSFASGTVIKPVSSTGGGCSSYRSRSYEQFSGESNAIQEQSNPQTPRGYGITKAKVTKEEYTGIIFCPTVSTGAFVARRNGKVFITGNSGFPKSLDVSKAIDKVAGAEREIIGTSSSPNNSHYDGERYKEKRQTKFGIVQDQPDKTAPATDAAKQWNGWGTALKPAWEPIILCRKPLEGTVAENIQKWGTGGINIDGCRVAANDFEPKDRVGAAKLMEDRPWQQRQKIEGRPRIIEGNSLGRFPANLIHDGSDEVLALFPDTKSGSLTAQQQINGGFKGTKNCYGTANAGGTNEYEQNSGSAARFFYCAKASKSERNLGCETLPLKTAGECTDRQEDTAGLNSPRAGACRTNGATNFHPTVKPLALLQYLCRLITPPGGLILDQFAGSGSIGVAAHEEGFDYLLIEVDPEYAEIAKIRNAQVRLPR